MAIHKLYNTWVTVDIVISMNHILLEFLTIDSADLNVQRRKVATLAKLIMFTQT